MHTYTFVRIRALRSREGLTLERDHREVIREHAARGWVFTQAIPFTSDSEPHWELVFVKGE